MAENTDNLRKTIPRAYITTAIPTVADARVIVGADALEEKVNEELIAITELRKKCMVWAKDKVKQIQFEEAFGEQKMEDVRGWGDIRTKWKEEGGEENQKRLYHIMYGVFERESKWDGRSWQQRLEEQFMDNENLRYPFRDIDPMGKGKRKRKEAATGIQKIIMNERNELNKLINGRSRKSHGICIKIKRIDGKRRKLDHFTNQYVSLHRTKEREGTKSEKIKQMKKETSTIKLNEDHISKLVEAEQKLNSSQANTITEKLKKKKASTKKASTKKTRRTPQKTKKTQKKDNSRESRDKKKSWMEMRREKRMEHNNRLFNLIDNPPITGKSKGKYRISTTPRNICITKTNCCGSN